MRILAISLLCLSLGCAAKKPVANVQPNMRVVQVHTQLKGCTIQGKIATCECSPVHTNIDSKSGKTTVVCKFHVENPQ
jgi:hypothetical protein